MDKFDKMIGKAITKKKVNNDTKKNDTKKKVNKLVVDLIEFLRNLENSKNIKTDLQNFRKTTQHPLSLSVIIRSGLSCCLPSISIAIFLSCIAKST